MTRVSEISSYQSPWLKGEDLQGRTVKATVAGATVEDLPQSDGGKQPKIILRFVGKAKKFILNRTQAAAMVAIAGDQLEGWAGRVVLLSPQPAQNGKLTIAILPNVEE